MRPFVVFTIYRLALQHGESLPHISGIPGHVRSMAWRKMANDRCQDATPIFFFNSFSIPFSFSQTPVLPQNRVQENRSRRR